MTKINVLNKKGVKVAGVSGGMIIPPVIDFIVNMEIPSEIEKEVAKDKLLIKRFGDTADELLKFTIKMVEDKIKIFEKLFQGMLLKGEKASVIDANLKGLNAALLKDFEVARIAAEANYLQAWDELLAHKKEWKKYKIKVAVSIVGTVCVLAVSIAALASSPWSGGAGAAFAIIGFIKAGVKIAQDIKRIAIGFDASVTELEGHLKFVEATAKNKGVYAASEVTAAVLNEFLGVAQPSIKSAQTCYDTMKAKYSQMVVNSHALSKECGKIEKQQEKLKADFLKEAAVKMKGLNPMVIKGNATKIQNNYAAMMSPLIDDLKKKEAQVDALYEKTKEMAPVVKALGERIKALEVKDPKGLKVFREALKFAVLGLAPLNGNGIADKAGDLAMGIGGAAGGYAYDKIASRSIEGTLLDAA